MSPRPGDLAARANPAELVVRPSQGERRGARDDRAGSVGPGALVPEPGAQNRAASAVLVALEARAASESRVVSVAPENRVASVVLAARVGLEVLDGPAALGASVGLDRAASMSVLVAWGLARWGLVTWLPARWLLRVAPCETDSRQSIQD